MSTHGSKEASMEPQIAPAVLMIRPVAFHANPETMGTNAFQRPVPALSPTEVQALARAEHDGLAQALTDAGVRVLAFDDTASPATPDAIFPNNWVSFHPDGTVVLYPMHAPNRRLERRPELLDRLREAFKVGEVVDLSPAEARGKFLEGTGSLVLDRVHKVAYACRSPRTDAGLLGDWAARFGYQALAFDAVDAAGKPIYHTNVLMCVGPGFAVMAPAALPDWRERATVIGKLERTGHEVIALGEEQLVAFAGNMLALQGRDGTVLAMSQAAHDALRPDQRQALARHATLVVAPVPTIEAHAGGSVRCMLAEISLPPI